MDSEEVTKYLSLEAYNNLLIYKSAVLMPKDVWDKIVKRLEIVDILKHSKCHTEKHIGTLSMLTIFNIEGVENIKKIEDWYNDK